MNIHEETLKIARNLIKKDPSLTDWVISKFPELKESEDDSVIKWIINEIRDNMNHEPLSEYKKKAEKAIAWLEKQGEKRSADSYCRENCKGYQETGKCFADEDCKAKMEAELIDKIESKFHEGEWITNGDYTWKIVEIEPLNYILQSQDGNISDDTISHIDEEFHSFTINDAKIGDVLITVYNKYPFIYKGCLDSKHPDSPVAYCGIDTEGYFCLGNKSNLWWTGEKVCPATKEQRDTLIKAMDGAGYEFDFEKKEFKKIEQKSTDMIESKPHNYITPNQQFFQWIYDRLINVHNENPNVDYMLSLKERIENMQKTDWSEENDMMIDETLYFLREYQHSDRCKDENDMQNSVTCENWLKSLKDRVVCEANCTTTKEWSEDEESIINKAESWLDTLCDYLKDSSPEYISDIKDVINKLKSIKDRYTWKPSSIQMECLHKYAEQNNYDGTILTSLYNDLKQL